jgi:hypothetical protein
MAGKMRSPNYPALGLSQAVEAARKLWDKEKRTPVAHATAATALGYGSLSGPARIAIAALRQYGLVDKPDPGHVKLSDRALRVLHGDEEAKKKALVEAASAPKLFRELAATHLDGSDNAIRSYLITKKDFSEEGARKAVKSFRDTVKLASPDASGYTADGNEEDDDDMEGIETGQKAKNALDGGGKPPESVFSLTVPFSKGSISVQVRVSGDAMRPSHLARVRKYLELAESDWGTPDDEMGVPKPQ